MTRFCPACGFEFPPPERRVTTLPAARAILTTEPEWLEVKGVTYRKHEKPGSPPSLRVDYRTGLNGYREWICLEHTGYARAKAESWWLRRASAPVPGSVDAALERLQELNEPTHIRIRTKGKYTEISGHRFDVGRLAA